MEKMKKIPDRQLLEELLNGKVVKITYGEGIEKTHDYLSINHNDNVVNNSGFRGRINFFAAREYEITEKPKPKVMRAQYTYKHTTCISPLVTNVLFKDDSEFKDHFKSHGIKLEWFKRLEEVECES